MDEVKSRMQEVQMGATLSGNEAAKVSQIYTVQETQEESFNKVIGMIVERLQEGDSLEQAVEKHYDLCDYDFMQELKRSASDPKVHFKP